MPNYEDVFMDAEFQAQPPERQAALLSKLGIPATEFAKFQERYKEPALGKLAIDPAISGVKAGFEPLQALKRQAYDVWKEAYKGKAQPTLQTLGDYLNIGTAIGAPGVAFGAIPASRWAGEMARGAWEELGGRPSTATTARTVTELSAPLAGSLIRKIPAVAGALTARPSLLDEISRVSKAITGRSKEVPAAVSARVFRRQTERAERALRRELGSQYAGLKEAGAAIPIKPEEIGQRIEKVLPIPPEGIPTTATEKKIGQLAGQVMTGPLAGMKWEDLPPDVVQQIHQQLGSQQHTIGSLIDVRQRVGEWLRQARSGSNAERQLQGVRNELAGLINSKNPAIGEKLAAVDKQYARRVIGTMGPLRDVAEKNPSQVVEALSKIEDPAVLIEAHKALTPMGQSAVRGTWLHEGLKTPKSLIDQLEYWSRNNRSALDLFAGGSKGREQIQNLAAVVQKEAPNVGKGLGQIRRVTGVMQGTYAVKDLAMGLLMGNPAYLALGALHGSVVAGIANPKIMSRLVEKGQLGILSSFLQKPTPAALTTLINTLHALRLEQQPQLDSEIPNP